MNNQVDKAEIRSVKVPTTQSIVEGWLRTQEQEAFEQAAKDSETTKERQDSYKGKLYDRLFKHTEARRAFLLIEHSLLRQDWPEVIRLLGYAAECMDVQTLLYGSTKTEFAEKILYYPFPELIVPDLDLLNQFRTRWSYVALLDSTLVSPGHWLLAWELIAVLLGTDYDVVLNPVQKRTEGIDNSPEMDGFLPEPHSTSITERGLHCPNYPQFANMSFAGRRCMAFAIYRNLAGHVVDGARLREYLHEDYAAAVDECAGLGLLKSDLKPVDYLPYLTNDALKAILNERAIRPKNTKSQLVDAVQNSLSTDEVSQYVIHLMNRDDLRITFQTGKLRQMLSNETERFNQWEVRLSKALVEQQPRLVPMPSLENAIIREELRSRTVESSSRYRFMPVVKHNPSALERVTQLPVWTNYWDGKCDLIVSDYGKKLGWNGFRESARAITAYWGAAKAARFATDTHGLRGKLLGGVAEIHNSILDIYCEARRIELGVEGPMPQIRPCDGCGREFSEDSIPPNLAGLAGYYLGFCYDCLNQAFYRLIYPHKETTASREELIAKLVDLCGVLEQIPQAQFAHGPKLPLGIQPEKAKVIIRALMSFPVYTAYVSEFGSWFKALLAVGALKDEPLRTARGYKTVASDGHECYSLPELTIDNWLSNHALKHEKEPLYPFHPTLNQSGRLRADWKADDCYIEYFGMMEESDYRDKAEAKVKLAKDIGLPLVVILPEDIFKLDDKLGFLHHL